MFQEVLRQVPYDSEQCTHNIQTATVIFSFMEKRGLASELSTLYLDRIARIRRVADLRIMNRLAPNEPSIAKASRDTQDLTVPFAALTSVKKSTVSLLDEEGKSDLKSYQKHCAQCHGDNGDGLGSASRFLSPPARSFVAEPMRYISDLNRIATHGDIRQTILHGLNGTSMPAFKRLAQAELDQLVRQVRRFQSREGSPASRENNSNGCSMTHLGRRFLLVTF